MIIDLGDNEIFEIIKSILQDLKKQKILTAIEVKSWLGEPKNLVEDGDTFNLYGVFIEILKLAPIEKQINFIQSYIDTYRESLNESLKFERHQQPKDAMEIGAKVIILDSKDNKSKDIIGYVIRQLSVSEIMRLCPQHQIDNVYEIQTNNGNIYAAKFEDEEFGKYWGITIDTWNFLNSK